MKLTTLEEQINTKASLDFGAIFNNSIELFKKVWVQGFIVLLLTFICILPCYLLFYSPVLTGIIVDPEMLRHEEPNLIVLISTFTMFPIIMVLFSAIILLLNAGFLRICARVDKNLEGSDDYFYYFKRRYFGKALVLSLVIIGISILGMLLCFIGAFYVMVPIALIPAFFTFNEDLTPIEMVKASFVLGNKNWGVIFGMLIVMGFLAQLGILLCGIGVLFTAMLAKVPIYYMYKDGVGFPTSNNTEDTYLVK
ncbi:hypothetical protein [Spongiimicrobium salis]|uniref:hypothetical protein n=1 Tax=Spongiimicrobium salis TaxID=1667022 RepID=UPI00374DB252